MLMKLGIVTMAIMKAITCYELYFIPEGSITECMKGFMNTHKVAILHANLATVFCNLLLPEYTTCLD